MIEHNGKHYARVTEVLQPLCDFSHVDPWVLKNKCRIGTNVHKAIEDDFRGDFPILREDEAGYYESYERWAAEIKPRVLRSEERYYDSSKMLCGQIDAVLDLGWTDLPVLVDFKTSAQESKKVWPLQAHLYAYLLAQNGLLVGPSYQFIKLDKLGALPQVFTYMWNQNTHALCMGLVDKFWLTQ